jgi:hypothetical protein
VGILEPLHIAKAGVSGRHHHHVQRDAFVGHTLQRRQRGTLLFGHGRDIVVRRLLVAFHKLDQWLRALLVAGRYQ